MGVDWPKSVVGQRLLLITEALENPHNIFNDKLTLEAQEEIESMLAGELSEGEARVQAYTHGYYYIVAHMDKRCVDLLIELSDVLVPTTSEPCINQVHLRLISEHNIDQNAVYEILLNYKRTKDKQLFIRQILHERNAGKLRTMVERHWKELTGETLQVGEILKHLEGAFEFETLLEDKAFKKKLKTNKTVKEAEKTVRDLLWEAIQKKIDKL